MRVNRKLMRGQESADVYSKEAIGLRVALLAQRTPVPAGVPDPGCPCLDAHGFSSTEMDR
jgi:hypothetical protein